MASEHDSADDDFGNDDFGDDQSDPGMGPISLRTRVLPPGGPCVSAVNGFPVQR